MENDTMIQIISDLVSPGPNTRNQNEIGLEVSWMVFYTTMDDFYYTVVMTLAFLYQLNIGFSPFLVSVSSVYAQPSKNA